VAILQAGVTILQAIVTILHEILAIVHVVLPIVHVVLPIVHVVLPIVHVVFAIVHAVLAILQAGMARYTLTPGYSLYRRRNSCHIGRGWNPVATAPGSDFDSDRTYLLIHLHKIKVVPGFDNLAILDSGDRNAGEFDRRLGRGKAQTVAGMFTAHAATCGDHVAFGNLIFDDHFDLRKGFAELGMEWQETSRAAQRLRRVFRQSMDDAIFG
jgi:hypothetical protein